MMLPMNVSLGREAKVREGLELMDRYPTTVLSEGKMMVARTALL
jgi:hypothetical protein